MRNRLSPAVATCYRGQEFVSAYYTCPAEEQGTGRAQVQSFVCAL